MKKIIIILGIAFLPIIANAETVKIDGIWYELDSEVASAEVACSTNDTKYSGDVIIPMKVIYNGIRYTVKGVGYGAFSGCTVV